MPVMMHEASSSDCAIGPLVVITFQCMQSSREELLDDIEELKKKVTGSAEKLSS